MRDEANQDEGGYRDGAAVLDSGPLAISSLAERGKRKANERE